MAEYTIKFYPNANAFKISPSPKFSLNKSENKIQEFRWIFDDNDIIHVHWIGEGGKNFKNVYLEFRSLDYSERCMQIEIFDEKEEKWINVNKEVESFFSSETKNSFDHKKIKDFIRGRYHLDTKGTIRIIKKDDYKRWSFDFCCEKWYSEKGGGSYRHCRIDPEMKIGSGTN